jgi:Co/Zn/Cd efflux system component
MADGRLGPLSTNGTRFVQRRFLRPMAAAGRLALLAAGPGQTCDGGPEAVLATFRAGGYSRLASQGERKFMSGCCQGDACSGTDPRRGDPAFKRVLWIVLAINAVMFLVEIVAGVTAGSTALQADALDFLGDTASYAISLFVVGMALRYRSVAALAKGATMALFGAWVVVTVAWHSIMGTVPEPLTMGVIGAAALISNAVCFALLYAYRSGDANMRSVWVCSRNDVLGNLAVLLAALGVFGTGSGWPDLIVATVMALLAIQGAVVVVRHALQELDPARSAWLAKAAVPAQALRRLS